MPLSLVEKKPPPLLCSFCGKTEDEVLVVVAGVNASMCDECVDVAVQVVADSRAKLPKAQIINQQNGGQK